MRRIIASALRQAEQALTLRIRGRLASDVVDRMPALIERAVDPEEDEGAMTSIGTVILLTYGPVGDPSGRA
ncbi:hypothetical protein AB0B45_44925 [Nonomuraea sp. NPDC049152]|uniref:hypothetical protein n=1 Tax=Nonomuraea sp. NPDC049152 TaxID=3154350 RepID=UPI00340AE8CC